MPPIALLTSAAPPGSARHPVPLPLPPAPDGTRCRPSVPVGRSGVPPGAAQAGSLASELVHCPSARLHSARPPLSPSQVVKGEMGNSVGPQTQSLCWPLVTPQGHGLVWSGGGHHPHRFSFVSLSQEEWTQPRDVAQQEARGPGFSILTRILRPNRINVGTVRQTYIKKYSSGQLV